MTHTIVSSFLAVLLLCPIGCGTFTGIPAHGGGKRFAIEQELVAASAIAAAHNLDVSDLVGKKCSVNFVCIGDEGGGSLFSGRYGGDGLLRGEYQAVPVQRTDNRFPVLPSATSQVTESTSSAPGAAPTTTRTETGSAGTAPLNFPSRSRVVQDGFGFRSGGGGSYQSSSYQNFPFLNPNDAVFLESSVHEALLLKGVIMVPPELAEVDVFIAARTFGTHRRRLELAVYNEERLLARTGLVMSAVSRDRTAALRPRSVAWEAEYVEKYVLWNGPLAAEKSLRPSDESLVAAAVPAPPRSSRAAAPVAEEPAPTPPAEPTPTPTP